MSRAPSLPGGDKPRPALGVGAIPLMVSCLHESAAVQRIAPSESALMAD